MNQIKWEIQHQQVSIAIISGDLTQEPVDAIVNAANRHLMHGGGVAGAIVQKGGNIIQEESYEVAPVKVGECAVTSAGSLPAKYVIHAVGPVWGEGNEEVKLRSAVYHSLQKAGELKLESISLPAISSGIFGYPKELCARNLFHTTIEYLEKNPATSLRKIRFCLLDAVSLNIFMNEFKLLSKSVKQIKEE